MHMHMYIFGGTESIALLRFSEVCDPGRLTAQLEALF